MGILSVSPEQRAITAEAVAKANNGKTASSGGTGLDGDFSFFLKMLTTQLQNQDPTEPMDVTQMTQQIAQYTGVEQQVKTNTALEKLIASNNRSQLSTAVSYIGKEVETAGATGTLAYAQDGTQTGAVSWTYELPDGVKSATITVLDATGAEVFSGDGTVQKGTNKVSWNGLDKTTGKALPAGNYSIKVTAKDAGGNVINNIQTTGDGKLTYAPTQYGQAVFSYILPKGAQGATITLVNSKGQAVFTGQGTLKEGRNVVVWDGVNSFNGDAMAAGQYSIQVKAKDAAGKDITPETRSVGTVDTVENDAAGNIILNVGDVPVKYQDILAVRDATPFVTGS